MFYQGPDGERRRRRHTFCSEDARNYNGGSAVPRLAGKPPRGAMHFPLGFSDNAQPTRTRNASVKLMGEWVVCDILSPTIIIIFVVVNRLKIIFRLEYS